MYYVEWYETFTLSAEGKDRWRVIDYRLSRFTIANVTSNEKKTIKDPIGKMAYHIQ